MKKRSEILVLAGHDPSGGAGLTADIKTIEALKCYGFSVLTGNTVQNDITLKACLWTDIKVMKAQIDLLFDRFEIQFVKIGVIENWSVLDELIDYLLNKNSAVKIILDPIFKSSSNYTFHDETDWDFFDAILNKIFLLTPNYNEIEMLYGDENIQNSINRIAEKTNLYLKGGHKIGAIGEDELFTEELRFKFPPAKLTVWEKHGSGCVLSSAITSYLALGCSLTDAVEKGKRYTEKILSSNKNLLGYHG